MKIGMGIRLLETLTSALYEDPIVLFREYVQNSVDAFIKADIGECSEVNINIDRENRNIEFVDNGEGIPYDSFYETMISIGKSEKGKYIDQIGFRGIGRLSGMPFCDKLVFTNKCPNCNKLQVFSWNGTEYNSLLSKYEEDDLEKAIQKITHYDELGYTGNPNEHFFKVELCSYSEEISELVSNADFKKKLERLLPIKYSKSFSAQSEIKKHYENFMGYSLGKFEFNVKLNGEELVKPYENDNILESDIVFWDLSFKQMTSKIPAEKIGVLWFTFNRKVSANSVDSPRGIYVRSKNMLLGNENSIADAITKGNGEYVATYRELTQTINGVFGELLIDTSRLSDNARRDWFRIDSNSNELRIILTDYLRKLKNYRYAASQAFNDNSAKSKREKLIIAYKDLTGGFNSDLFEKKLETDFSKTEEKTFQYAEDDIPRYSVSAKKFYEEILLTIKDYLNEVDSEKGMDEFIRIRAYLKQHFNQR